MRGFGNDKRTLFLHDLEMAIKVLQSWSNTFSTYSCRTCFCTMQKIKDTESSAYNWIVFVFCMPPYEALGISLLAWCKSLSGQNYRNVSWEVKSCQQKQARHILSWLYGVSQGEKSCWDWHGFEHYAAGGHVQALQILLLQKKLTCSGVQAGHLLSRSHSFPVGGWLENTTDAAVWWVNRRFRYVIVWAAKWCTEPLPTAIQGEDQKYGDIWCGNCAGLSFGYFFDIWSIQVELASASWAPPPTSHIFTNCKPSAWLALGLQPSQQPAVRRHKEGPSLW